MKSILQAPFLIEFCKTASNLYRLGWDERNGGNISIILSEDEVSQYIDLDNVIRKFPIKGFDASEAAGMLFLVTGTGKYFKNVEEFPDINLGIVKISDDGQYAELLWGFSDGGAPTSEFPSHLMSHITRLEADPKHKVVIHTHPNNVIAMTFVHSLDEREFTKTLWQMCTECVLVFPDGIGVLPWMLCGNGDIAKATAEKLTDRRLVVWGMHGIFGTGHDLDETFGLIETVEKAADIYIKTASLTIKQTITDEQLRILANAFKVEVRKGYLD